MKTKIFILSAMAGLVMTACNKDNGDPEPPNAEPIKLRSEYKAKTENNRSFALDLFKLTVAESKGSNLFISPYSVNTVLSMTWNGTAGDTYDEMELVLGNSTYTKAQINDYYKTLNEALLKVDPSSELKIANSIWADKTTPFKESFVEVNKTWYNAEVRNVDFASGEALAAIDKWCTEKTDKKIKKISDGMNSDTRFALINAMYFKGKWKHKFEKSKTDKESFTNSNGVKATVEMMNQRKDLSYNDDDKDWKVLRLPYGNNAFSMIIMMPYKDEPLDAKIATLTADKYYDLIENMASYFVTVKLPKFTADYSYELHEKILPGMGLKNLFEPNQANFSEMSDHPMCVNMVMHKTYIEVSEEGTKAAAVTSSSGVATAPPPGSPIDFYVDRPFIYSIVENSTGTILFMGRVNGF